MNEKEMNEKVYDERHGGPYDRGTADSYYRRGRNPHYYKGATYRGEAITEEFMTSDEIEAYNAGYRDNTEAGDFKEYGRDD